MMRKHLTKTDMEENLATININEKPFRTIGFQNFLMRIFAGIGGGILGTSASLLIFVFFVSAQRTSPSFDASQEFSGLTILSIVLAGSLIANTFAIFFHTLVEPEKYQPRLEILTHTFSVNIFIFIAIIPFYLYFSNSKEILTTAGLHFFFSASASALIAEILSGRTQGIMAVFGVSLAQILLLSIYLLFTINTQSETLITILFLPFLWIVLPTTIFLVEKFRDILWSIFSHDVFSGK